ncbi:hypothetical protein Mpsy_2924 [Methanolobus psychrophilus R15]|nr:hypothetical protein Mpsy_2924 [Methanolobus psychrophilus R15]
MLSFLLLGWVLDKRINHHHHHHYIVKYNKRYILEKDSI